MLPPTDEMDGGTDNVSIELERGPMALFPSWTRNLSASGLEKSYSDSLSEESESREKDPAFLKPLKASEVYSSSITLQRCSNLSHVQPVTCKKERKRMKLNGQENQQPLTLIRRDCSSRWSDDLTSVSAGLSRRERDMERLETARAEDPKKAERILANRQSAERSRLRRLNAISTLSEEVSQLKSERAKMRAEMSQLKESLMAVSTKTHELADALNSKTALVDALKEALASSGQLDVFTRCCEGVSLGSKQIDGRVKSA